MAPGTIGHRVFAAGECAEKSGREKDPRLDTMTLFKFNRTFFNFIRLNKKLSE